MAVLWLLNSHHQSPTFICFLLSCFLTIFSFPTTFNVSAAALSFNFSSFRPNHSEIYTEKDAFISRTGIELTKNQRDMDPEGSVGRATYTKPFHLWDKASGTLANFTTHFSFIIASNENNYGYGLAFFLAPNGSRIPADTEADGGLGLAVNEQSHALNYSENNFIAVEFDTYQDYWDPQYTGDHIGINVRSMKSVNAVQWLSGVMEGHVTDVWISYDSTNKILEVMYTYIYYKGVSVIRENISAVVDMAKHLPEWVTLGFSASTGRSYQINRILSWEFNSSNLDKNGEEISVPPWNSEPPSVNAPPPNLELPRESKSSKAGMVGVVVGVCAVIVFAAGFVANHLRKKKRKREKEVKMVDLVFDVSLGDDFRSEKGPRNFSYKELSDATNNFSEDEMLGEGGFGAVHRGFLKELNSYVAVKRVSKRSKQGVKEYAAEVKIISRLRHRNLVKLIGWCHEKELLLAYEFMPNGSLDCHLFKGKSLLTWEIRYRIAQGLASALLYLHEEGDQCVLHRDIKSSNIMLDSDFNAKLGDFGLARLVDHAKGFQTTVLAGTMGYMAPECFTSGKASKESDIYSFGVVALEIACGRRAVEPKLAENQIRIVEWVWELYGIGKILEAADPKLGRDFNEQEIERLMIVGLWCVHPDHNCRPCIRQLSNVLLSSEAPLPVLPPEMPVAAYHAPPMKFSLSSYGSTFSSSDGEQPCRTDSSKLTS
ncbi:L-type lectin-domain containing receptor kinase IX.1 [Manihot esculenta]|uniref:non-specific serine/threonine protein kinase n=1 Tax=Manihot esculenta TaxID=3983 RepID=A0A2C9V6V0_MANES|nr:L-type lectin-domain containing receptor kinase IX.1 [Manihot esculenta]OAY39437.1 hypothetical protein MANES_10G094900v8 [Manihot esculenta]